MNLTCAVAGPSVETLESLNLLIGSIFVSSDGALCVTSDTGVESTVLLVWSVLSDVTAGDFSHLCPGATRPQWQHSVWTDFFAFRVIRTKDVCSH